MQKWHPIVVLLLGSIFIGCLGDDIVEEVKYRPILQPPVVKFKAEAPGNLIAQWAPSLTDTQTNFKGYYVELYESVQDKDPTIEIDSVFNLLDSVHVPKSDTFYVFQNIPPGRYSLWVYGERVPDPDNPDSNVLSKFPTRYSFWFDVTPVVAPTVFLAQSRGQGNVVVSWEASPSVSQPGMAGYILRYRDTTKTSNIFTIRSLGKGSAPQTYSFNFPLTPEGYESPYKIWIKGIRNDSTESVDSTILSWSGAHAVGPNQPTVVIGKKMFIGKTNSTYEIKELDQPTSQILVTAVDSTVTLEALEGARFSQQIDVTTLDSMFFSEPMPEPAFTETSLTLPRNPASSVCIYVLFAEIPLDKSRARARIMFHRDAGGTLIFGNAVKVEARFQPGTPPYFLPYF